MARHSPNRNIPALDEAGLNRLALAYVSRYATTRAKLAAYLARKADQRGWAEAAPVGPAIAAVIARMVELRYIDDRGFAEMRAEALRRRGYGDRRVRDSLRAAGIGEEDIPDALAADPDAAEAAAHAFARRRRFGPYATHPAGPDGHRRQMAAMLRAGHSYAVARTVLLAHRETETD